MSREDLVAWLAGREPAPPAGLAARLRQGVEEAPAEFLERPLPDALLAIGKTLLEEVVACGCAERASALDLLAADSFITYAFEAQSELNHQELARLAQKVRTA